MKSIRRILTADFSQRPSSRLKCHVRVFRLRTPLAIEQIRVLGTRNARLVDLHKLFAHYSVAVEIGVALEWRWMLGEISGGTPAWFRNCRPTKNITVKLICAAAKLCDLPKLLPGLEGGNGFTIRIEIQGNTLCPEKDARRAGQKRSDKKRSK